MCIKRFHYLRSFDIKISFLNSKYLYEFDPKVSLP